MLGSRSSEKLHERLQGTEERIMRPVIEAEAAGFRPCRRCEPNGRFEKRLTREGGAA